MAIRYLGNIEINLNEEYLDKRLNGNPNFTRVNVQDKYEVGAATTDYLINKKINNLEEFREEIYILLGDIPQHIYFIDLENQLLLRDQDELELFDTSGESEPPILDRKELSEIDKTRLTEEYIVRCVDDSISLSKNLKENISDNGLKMINIVNKMVDEDRNIGLFAVIGNGRILNYA